MFVVVLSACGEEDEQTLPMPQDVTAEHLDSCLSGKGWIHVSSHEVRANGTLDKTEYWSQPDAGRPNQYYFDGDSLTTFLSTEAYTVNGYQTVHYTYNRGTHKLESPKGEVFKVISVSQTELCVVKYQGFDGNGLPIYIYSTYRVMNAGEIVKCRGTHPYNLATINKDYPILPEQMLITPTGFKQNVVNHGWKCTAAYRMETNNRYSKASSQAMSSTSIPDNLFFTADSLIAFKAGVFHDFKVNGRLKYSFRANSFTLDTGTGSAMRVLSLTADEMRLLLPTTDNADKNSHGLYCIYKKMTAEELASTTENNTANTTTGS